MRRGALALVVVMGLMAFAPAPLPKPARRGSETISLEKFQGTWRSVKLALQRKFVDFRRKQAILLRDRATAILAKPSFFREFHRKWTRVPCV